MDARTPFRKGPVADARSSTARRRADRARSKRARSHRSSPRSITHRRPTTFVPPVASGAFGCVAESVSSPSPKSSADLRPTTSSLRSTSSSERRQCPRSLKSKTAQMRNASCPFEREGFSCAACGQVVITRIEGLFSNPKVGSPRRFCSLACRVAAHRRRQAGIPENTPLRRTGGRNRRLGAQEELPVSGAKGDAIE